MVHCKQSKHLFICFVIKVTISTKSGQPNRQYYGENILLTDIVNRLHYDVKVMRKTKIKFKIILTLFSKLETLMETKMLRLRNACHKLDC